jgi:hypothetical protein
VAGPGNILIRVGADAGQAVSELSKVNRALGDNMTKSEKIGAALKRAAVPATIALGAIAVGAKKAISAASDLNEQQNKAQVVFGKSGKAIVAWSKTLAESFGLSSTAALEAAGTFGNMLVPMGFSRKEAAKMSKTMVQLAGDMASFNNASPEETLAALRSGLAGESEPLRKFGVFLSDARLKQEALRQGLYSGKGALDAHAKAAATMALIMKDTSDAQGDFARTSDSAANAQRVQAAETANLTAELGQGLLPYYQTGLALLIKLTKATAGHTGAVKVAIGVVAGLSAAIIAANAAMKAWAAVQGIAKAATIAWTVAQRLLNFALVSNPIGLVIVAVAALGAALVIAYRRSETFRAIVQASLNGVLVAARALASGFTHVMNAASSAFSWIVSHWRVAAFALGPIGAALVLLVTHFDKVENAGRRAFGAVAAAVNALRGAIDAVVGSVKSLIGWLGKIHVPKINLPNLPGRNMAAGYGYGAPAPAGLATAGGGGGGLTVNFYGPVDPEGSARAILKVLRAHEVRQGRAAMRQG